jgi:Transcription-repair coupling factor (superfamily II helicase)
MYLKLMNKAIKEINNEHIAEEIETVVDISYEGYIPDSYIPSLNGKIQFYRDIMKCKNEEELIEIEKELTDRFGNIPFQLNNIFLVKRIKILASF